jgi:hypothetical protein
MKPAPGAVDDYLLEDENRDLLEGMEGTSVAEKLVDTDFFNKFEVTVGLVGCRQQAAAQRGGARGGMCCCFCPRAASAHITTPCTPAAAA